MTDRNKVVTRALRTLFRIFALVLPGVVLLLGIVNYWLDFGVRLGRFSLETFRACPTFSFRTWSSWDIWFKLRPGDRGPWDSPEFREYFTMPKAGMTQFPIGLNKNWWFEVPWWTWLLVFLILAWLASRKGLISRGFPLGSVSKQ